MDMGIWVVGTSHQPLTRGSSTEKKKSRKKIVTGKSPVFVIGPFCTHWLLILQFFMEMICFQS